MSINSEIDRQRNTLDLIESYRLQLKSITDKQGSRQVLNQANSEYMTQIVELYKQANFDQRMEIKQTLRLHLFASQQEIRVE